MEQTKATPIYQRLFQSDGTELSDNTQTMAQLNIVPNQTLELEIFDESDATHGVGEHDSPQSKRPEKGFKGTGLYGFDGGARKSNGGPAASAVEEEPPEPKLSEQEMLDEAIRRSMEDAGGNGNGAPVVAPDARGRANEDTGSDSDAVNRRRPRKRPRMLNLDSSPERSVAKPSAGKTGKPVNEVQEIASSSDEEEEVPKGRKRAPRNLGPPARQPVAQQNDIWDLDDGDADPVTGPDPAKGKPSKLSARGGKPSLDLGRRSLKPAQIAAPSSDLEEDIMEVDDGDKWSCSKCTLLNKPYDGKCNACGAKRGG